MFAREFIVHLENKLSNPTMKMTPEQTALVEANLQEIRDLKKLSDCYTADLLCELSECLQKELLPTRKFQFHEGPNNWAFCCEEDIGQLRLEFIFQTPGQDSKGDFVIAPG